MRCLLYSTWPPHNEELPSTARAWLANERTWSHSDLLDRHLLDRVRKEGQCFSCGAGGRGYTGYTTGRSSLHGVRSNSRRLRERTDSTAGDRLSDEAELHGRDGGQSGCRPVRDRSASVRNCPAAV